MHGGLVLWLKGWARMAESRRRAGERREGRCHKMGRSVFQTLLGMGESRVMCRCRVHVQGAGASAEVLKSKMV